MLYIYGLIYTKVVNVNLIGYIDADYANDFKSRKSLTGYIFKMSNDQYFKNMQNQFIMKLM